MARVRIVFQGGVQLGPKFNKNLQRHADNVRRSAQGAAQDARDEFLERGRADIAGAGNFGSRWTEGLMARITQGGGNIVINVSHAVSYFMVHQRGAVIRGKPLLWIPLSFAEDAKGVRARDFPGGLFRVDRKRGGAPLLLAIKDGRPKYFGKEQVRIPKRFHVLEIGREIGRKLKDFYKRRFVSERRAGGN
jgi:hypothetical protein